MPGLIERFSFLQYAGWWGTSDFGSATRPSSQHGRRAIDEPAHLAAPFDVDFLAGLDLADVHFDRCSGCLGALARP
jgi:hypothetical protein